MRNIKYFNIRNVYDHYFALHLFMHADIRHKTFISCKQSCISRLQGKNGWHENIRKRRVIIFSVNWQWKWFSHNPIQAVAINFNFRTRQIVETANQSYITCGSLQSFQFSSIQWIELSGLCHFHSCTTSGSGLDTEQCGLAVCIAPRAVFVWWKR
jgi:hypothetical protein